MLAGVAAVVLIAEATPVSPAPGPAAGKIVAVADTGLNVLNTDGSGRRQITDGYSDGPRWSPDGSWIAFTRITGNGTAVYVVRPDGTGLRRVGMTEAVGVEAKWAPTGMRLAFNGCAGFCVMDVERGTQQSIAADDPPFGLSWSPDGTSIMFGGNVLTVADVATRARRTLRVANATDLWRPSWSPDGTMIAFLNRRGNDDVAVVSAAGGTATILAKNVDASTPAWSPDGRELLYVQGNAVHAIAVASRRGRRLTDGVFFARAPKWSPDGGFVVFERERLPRTFTGSDVWITRADGTSARPLTRAFPTGAGYSAPDWASGSVSVVAPPEPRPSLTPRPSVAHTSARPVEKLASDGTSAAFATSSVYGSCGPVGVWSAGRVKAVPPDCGDAEGISQLALGGGRVAWTYSQETNETDLTVVLAAVPGRGPVEVRVADHNAGAGFLGNLEGEGSLLVFQTSGKDGRHPKVWRIVGGARPVAQLMFAAVDPLALASVDDGRIALVRPSGRVLVVAANGRVAARLPAVARGAGAVVLAGSQLAVERRGVLSIYDLQTGRLQHRRTLSRTAGTPRLEDIGSGYAAFASGIELHVLRLRDGRDRIVNLADSTGPVHAVFADRGLYLSYNRAYDRRPGRLLLLPWRTLGVR